MRRKAFLPLLPFGHDLSEEQRGIEHNGQGERADAYLYCVEVKPEGCDYYIPLAPSWVIAEKFRIVASWERVEGSDRLKPVVQAVTTSEFKLYKDKKGATIINGRVVDPFDPVRSWSIEALRGQEGLRRWSNEDLAARPDDIFQERLYCVRWINGHGERRYAAPEVEDHDREEKVLLLLRERFSDWQSKGFIPSRPIPENGDKTDEPIRTRGWTHWHHLFTPRQLLLHGLISETWDSISTSIEERVAALLALGRIANFDSKLCIWGTLQGGGIGGGVQTFSNQALNPLYNYQSRSIASIVTSALSLGAQQSQKLLGTVQLADARDITHECDIWVTDPPYADALD